jgi:hypothetical protein
MASNNADQKNEKGENQNGYTKAQQNPIICNAATPPVARARRC